MGYPWDMRRNNEEELELKKDPKNKSSKGDVPLEKIGNRIYFYSSIYNNSILNLNKNLRELNNDLLFDEKLKGLPQETNRIKLNINSGGGSIFAGLSAMDEILKSEIPVDTIVDGMAASAATFLSVVGKRRYIKKNSYMLIHQLSSEVWGNMEQLKDDMINNELLMKKIKDIYKEYTKVPKSQLDKILKRDLFWDAEKCLEFSLVDEII